MTDVSLGGAFIAGVISFLSPCVLPLVPGYISMLSGISVEQLRRGEAPNRAFQLRAGVCYWIFGGVHFVRGVRERGRGLPAVA